jgi:hypothetical protein
MIHSPQLLAPAIRPNFRPPSVPRQSLPQRYLTASRPRPTFRLDPRLNTTRSLPLPSPDLHSSPPISRPPALVHKSGIRKPIPKFLNRKPYDQFMKKLLASKNQYLLSDIEDE